MVGGLRARFLGRVRYRRTFQTPTGLESGERVFLVVEPPRSRGAVSLSGKPLGYRAMGRPGRTVSTSPTLLEDHNRLEIIVDHPALDDALRPDDDGVTNLPGGLVGEVRLEIEE